MVFKMLSCAEVLHFQLRGHEAVVLCSMTWLQAEDHFCNVTIVAQSLPFRGRRVILYAFSPFLHDQFLLNPAAELRMLQAHTNPVLADLLLSWYMGTLEFARRVLVNYLTAASYLQIEHMVVCCHGALARFVQLPPAAPTQLPEPEEDEDKEDEEDVAPDVYIVKVEPAATPHRRREMRAWPAVATAKAARVAQEGGVAAAAAAVAGTAGTAAQDPPCSPQLGVGKACYSLAKDGEGEGLLIFPGGSGEEPVGSVGTVSPLGVAVAGTGLVVSTPSASLRCRKCREAFQGVEKLVFHMCALHFVFMCLHCGKQFNHSSNWNQHMNVHRSVKSHGCGICSKTFTQKSMLHNHLNLHSGAWPYRCSYCDMRFTHKASHPPPPQVTAWQDHGPEHAGDQGG
ncbi:zinc finger and BTB domain-containing protein 12-like [Corvus moneduloides]|uniref:zinc finger and BTB domain-containing protein 12-like n=1 Tax=Corvus moneduloides TaxID=1196302 RepID=UPI001364146D|nr:zinc finger and BTB domain-containing protein 12-like [Corvus moneduloides]